MAAARDSLFIDRPPGWPAWLVSLVIHACLLAAGLLWFHHLPARGADEEATREVGIVFKQMTVDGPMFEGETNDGAEPTLQPAPAGDPTLAVLPSSPEIPDSTAALPQLPTLGPGMPTWDRVGDIGQMSSGGAPSKGIGSPATVRLFGIEGTGTRFVYVFDRSISMAGPPLRAAKRQLIRSLSGLESVHQFQVIFFNHEPQAWDLTGGQGRIAFATDANKRLAERFIESTSATGGTFRRTALQLALRLKPDVVFFLTDTDDPMAARDLSDAIRRAQRDSIAIHSIEYGSGVASPGKNFLVQLARETGGRYVYVDTQALGR